MAKIRSIMTRAKLGSTENNLIGTLCASLHNEKYEDEYYAKELEELTKALVEKTQDALFVVRKWARRVVSDPDRFQVGRLLKYMQQHPHLANVAGTLQSYIDNEDINGIAKLTI
jgi:hypothetical protein